MTKTIEEEIRTYAKMCSLDEAGYVAIEKAIQFGIDLHKSLPLSQRLTDEERERVKTMYSEAQGWLDEKPTSDSYNSCLRICAVTIQDRLESIFGKELFGEE